ncbi:MAG: YihY/virulence factor BrkB family protein [Nocardioides sp.]|nr:YihY/virulence factor BrkB family protein [Nocardioides sp.]
MGRKAKAVDRALRRFPPVAFPLAVVYKFFDDQGNNLAAIITYNAFIAIFPLLLLASSILGFVLQGHPHLQAEVLETALAQFPIIGDELGRKELHGSTSAIIIGALTALYGTMGLGLSLQNAVNTAWSVPRNSRLNPILMRLRSLSILATAGLAVLSVTIITIVFTTTSFLGEKADSVTIALVVAGNIVIVTTTLTIVFRMATTRDHPFAHSFPGAATFAVLWSLLQWSGSQFVQHVLGATRGMNQTFALVLGLVGFLYIAAIMVVLSIQVNVVYARHLWPRALLTPFTDNVDLTEADRRAYASYALMQRHKGFETVSVTFDGRDGNTHEIVMDPSWLRKTARRIRHRDELSRPKPPTGPPPSSAPGKLHAVPSTDVAPEPGSGDQSKARRKSGS